MRRNIAVSARFPFATLPVTLAVCLVLGRSLPSFSAEISTETCAELVAHEPDADVAFQPGIGADGEAVLPADIDAAPPITAPDVFVIDVTAPLRGRFVSDALVGTVLYDGGRLSFNGQPLGADETAQITAVCRGRR